MHDRQKELSASKKLLELIRADKITSAESIKSDAAGDREPETPKETRPQKLEVVLHRQVPISTDGLEGNLRAVFNDGLIIVKGDDGRPGKDVDLAGPLLGRELKLQEVRGRAGVDQAKGCRVEVADAPRPADRCRRAARRC